MRPAFITDEAIIDFISRALEEDIGDGDHTSLSSISNEAVGNAKLLIKGDGIIAGIEPAEMIFNFLDTSISFKKKVEDGDQVGEGDTAFVVYGNTRHILAAERLVLNCMQRMSGIASYTNKLKKLIEHTSAKIYDTRKTTPNFRMFEKWGVAIGGGVNHRFGLYDQILLKDNHVDFAGGIKKAVSMAHDYLSKEAKDLLIEVETRTLDEVKQALETGKVDIIMLDNMNTQMMKEAVNIIGGKCKVEASGGITEDNIKKIAECGVDYISVGALTHSYKALDMSLKAF